MADYVAVTGTRGGATAAGGPFMLPSLSPNGIEARQGLRRKPFTVSMAGGRRPFISSLLVSNTLPLSS